MEFNYCINPQLLTAAEPEPVGAGPETRGPAADPSLPSHPAPAAVPAPARQLHFPSGSYLQAVLYCHALFRSGRLDSRQYSTAMAGWAGTMAAGEGAAVMPAWFGFIGSFIGSVTKRERLAEEFTSITSLVPVARTAAAGLAGPAEPGARSVDVYVQNMAVCAFISHFVPSCEDVQFVVVKKGSDRRAGTGAWSPPLNAHQALGVYLDTLMPKTSASAIVRALLDPTIGEFVCSNMPEKREHGNYSPSEILAIWLDFLVGTAQDNKWKNLDEWLVTKRVDSVEYHFATIMKVIPSLISDMLAYASHEQL